MTSSIVSCSRINTTMGRFLLYKRKLSELWLAKPRTSCRVLFKQLDIVRFSCQYKHSLKNFIDNKQEIFQRNSTIHNINTRNNLRLSSPNANLFSFRKSAFYVGTNIFNSLPLSVKIQRITRQILMQP